MTRVGTVLSPLLVGRDDLIELASRRLDEVSTGRGQFLLISGEPGIGKSRLLQATNRIAEGKGFQVSVGALAPPDREVPAAPFLDMARTMRRQPAFSELGDTLLGMVGELIAAEHAGRRLLVRRTVDLLVASLRAPTLLLFEDLHWADDLSLEILGELARQTRDAPLLLTAAYRTDEVAVGSLFREWRSRLVTQRLVEEVRLDRLTLEETGLMTTLIMASGLPAPREVVSAVYARTDGVPLHVEELLAALGPSALASSRAIRDADVPETLEDATVQRLRQLSPEAQDVARAGAVIGRCFVPDVLAGIMNLPPEAVDAPLQELLDADFLFPADDRGLFDFRHQLLRDAIYRRVPAGDRRRFHALAAEFGARLEGASEIHASLHFERAGMHEEAFRTALVGARRAAKLSAHREAFELYRRAVDNMPEGTPAEDRAAILLAYSNEAGAIEDNELLERLAQESRALYLLAGNGIRAAEAMFNILMCWRREGHPLADRLARGAQLLAELEAVPQSRERDTFRGEALGFQAVGLLDALDLDGARRMLMEYRDIAAKQGMDEYVFDADLWLGHVDVVEGRVEEGLAKVRQTAELAREKGYEAIGVTGFRDGALGAVRSMRYRQAAENIQDARLYADAIEQSHCARMMASTDGVLAWAAGDWDAAQRIGEQALADHGRGRAGMIARWALGFVAAGRGDREAAERQLQPAVAFGQRAEWLEMTMPPAWGLAEAALISGNPESAIDQCEAALAAALSVGDTTLIVPFVVTGVRAYVVAGRPEAAQHWFDRAAAAIGDNSTVAPPALDHARGLIRMSAGSITAARESLETAIAGWDERGRVWEGLWARLDLASAMLRSSRYVDATRFIGEVRTAARLMDSPPLLERADELERLARGRGAEQDAWHPLTVREFEVARQIATGMTNAEIGAVLFVSPKTVSAHVEHILAKLGAGRRAEIASWVSTIAQPVA